MTTPSEHHEYDELAAGHVLHSLAPDDERRFAAHLAQCARCQRSVSDHEEVAVAIADSVPQHQPPARLRASLFAELDRTPQQHEQATDAATNLATSDAADEPRPVSDLRPRRSRATAVFAAAAAVFLVAAVVFGVRANQLGHERDLQAEKAAGVQTVLAQAARPGAHLVAFSKHTTGSSSTAPVAVLATSGRTATVMSTGLGTTPADSVFVMWGLNGDQPTALGTFRVSADHPGPQTMALPADQAGSTSFGISVEPGSTAPAKPSNVLALGKTT